MRPLAGLVLVVAAAALGGCGGDDTGERSARPPAAADTAASTADPGLRVWAAQGCGSCHTFAAAGASGTFGPDLGQTLRGAPRALIRRAIVDPSATVAPGYSSGMMPEDFERRMSRPELERLVAFIDRGAH